MAIEWYNMTDYVSVGIDWNVTSVTETSYSIAPIIYRWDNQNTNNYSSSFSETLNPQPSGGAGHWSGLSWGSGSGTRQVDTFSTRTYEKTTFTQTINLTIEWDDSFGSYHNGSFITLGSGSYTWTCTIPALASYTVSYNVNGGTGAPGNQTKWYGKTLNLSATKPIKTGYKFVGWGTSATDTNVKYLPGGQYTGNANITLYAIWVSVAKLTINYDANGGSGAPSSQTHLINTVSKISDVKPTKTNYTFLGWSINSISATATYLANGQYTNNNFENGATITLYAIWRKNALPVYANVGDKKIKEIYMNIPGDKNIKSIYYKTNTEYPVISNKMVYDSNSNILLDSLNRLITCKG